MKLTLLRRRMIQFRFFLSRANWWTQLPTMGIVALGVLAPYIQQYVDISLWVMAAIWIPAMAFIGFIDWKLGFSKEDASFTQEQNKLLNRNVEELNRKLDLLLNKNE